MAEQEFTTEELESEEWRPVPGFDRYHISSLGRVRRVRDNGQLRLRALFLSRGYWHATLWKNNIGHHRSCHRLVAAAFIGPCPDGLEVNHIDGVKRNNRRQNLEYVTRKQNAQHASAIGLMRKGDNHPLRMNPGLVKRGAESWSSTHRERMARGERHGTRTHPESVLRGSKHPNARFTESEVLTIRRLHAAGGISIRAFARHYKASQYAIRCIIIRKTWTHI